MLFGSVMLIAAAVGEGTVDLKISPQGALTVALSLGRILFSKVDDEIVDDLDEVRF